MRQIMVRNLKMQLLVEPIGRHLSPADQALELKLESRAALGKI